MPDDRWPGGGGAEGPPPVANSGGDHDTATGDTAPAVATPRQARRDEARPPVCPDGGWGTEGRYVATFEPVSDPDPDAFDRFVQGVFNHTWAHNSFVRFGPLELHYIGSEDGSRAVWRVLVAGEAVARAAVNPAAFPTARALWAHLCALADALPAAADQSTEADRSKGVDRTERAER